MATVQNHHSPVDPALLEAIIEEVRLDPLRRGYRDAPAAGVVAMLSLPALGTTPRIIEIDPCHRRAK